MRLAIVGSSSISVVQEIEASEFIRMYSLLGVDMIISGGAKGVDTIAEDYARLHGIPVKIFYPETTSWEGYRARNIEIAEACSHMLCLRSITSKTYGSGWTADYADSLGKVVWREMLR